MKDATIDILLHGQSLSDLDRQFARFIGRISGGEAPELMLAAALASRSRGEGHICIDLQALAGTVVTVAGEAPLAYPAADRWFAALQACPVVGRPGERLPLILDGTRLYLFRYWEYEHRLARILSTLAGSAAATADEARLKEAFAAVFPPGGAGGEIAPDWQKVAAFAAARNRLGVISGGPGTGKTFTVAMILALLIASHPEKPLAIALTAPTGKAAARLQEAIRAAKSVLALPPTLKDAIPETASTLHRLLKPLPNSPYFRYDAVNQLPADVVVIDEASMVDLALFAKLAQALRPHARLILLGDKDQLASVEAGAVLGDLCDTGHEHGFSQAFADACFKVTGERIEADEAAAAGLNDCIVELTQSYRFGEESGIRALSLAVNVGDASRAAAILKAEDRRDIGWEALPKPDALPRHLAGWINERYIPALQAGDPAEALALFSRARILCALKEGPYGVRNLNAVVEQFLRAKGLIGRGGLWYAGRPVMIAKNDYTLKLFNGDIGITWGDSSGDGELRVFFPAADGSLRSFPPLRLPEHETVYAMTVHKSQGSEFDDVLFLMPDRDAPVLTRELVYTAVTRARESLRIIGREDIFAASIKRRIRRASGLRDALWGGTDTPISGWTST